MTDFKGGGIPTPNFENEDINFISQKTEFYDDVFVYGKLYAEFGGDVQSFSTANVERLRITSDGLIGIGSAGNTAPTAPLSIKVGSDGEYLQDFRGTATKQWGFYYDQGNWLESTFRIDEFNSNGAATSRLTITDGGKVGFGTDNPNGVVHIQQDVDNSSDYYLNSGNTVHIKNSHPDGYASLRLLGGASGSDNNAIVFGGQGSESLIFANRQYERFRINATQGVRIMVMTEGSDSPISDKTALLIQNGNGQGDIGTDSEPTHIDWAWTDGNTNVTPQCRISGNVGDGGDPNSQAKEGRGFLTFHCSNTNSTSGDLDPPQRLRIAHNGTFTGSSSNNISDQRLKENIATITDPITKIKALKGRTFTWKSEANMREGTHYGFIAQEVESIIPDLIVDDTGIRIFDKDDNLLPSKVITPPVGGGYAKSVDSDGVTPVLVEALKEALSKIETLEAKVAALEGS